jgi:hypothetical protein
MAALHDVAAKGSGPRTSGLGHDAASKGSCFRTSGLGHDAAAEKASLGVLGGGGVGVGRHVESWVWGLCKAREVLLVSV